jgi:hypothetical protein
MANNRRDTCKIREDLASISKDAIESFPGPTKKCCFP